MNVTRDEVLEVIPEFELISDDELREKAIGIWAEQLSIYGWKASDLEEIPFTTLIKDNPVSLAIHMRTLAKQCDVCVDLINKDYGDTLKINKDVLIAGALLHDIGKIGGTEKSENSFRESQREKLLHHSFSGVGILMSAGIMDEVVHAVALHSRDGEGRRATPEAVLLHHIDFMNYEALKLHK